MMKLVVLSLLVALTRATGNKGQTSHTETGHATTISEYFLGVEPGDFIYFYHSTDQKASPSATKDTQANKKADTRKDAIVECANGKEKSIYHVAMVVSDTEIVHATTSGVKKELLTEAVNSLQPSVVELTSVQLDGKKAAVEWALQKVGNAKYNDIFSSHFKNSEGEEAYYCCQFVQQAYIQKILKDGKKDPFPEHTLNFNDANGNLIAHWQKHYEGKKLKVPQGESGSHPSVQRGAAFIHSLAKKTIKC